VIPWVIAHRGASHECPENTHAAFARALEMGADAIELDLQLTSDREVVVYHDRTLAKIGHPRARIGELTLAQVQELDAGTWKDPRFAGERIPTLVDVLARYAGRTRLMLELKVAEDETPARRASLVDRTLQKVGAGPTRDGVHLLSFDARLLSRVSHTTPSLPLVLDVDEAPDSAVLGRALAGIDVLCLPARLCSARLGHEVRSRGRQLWAYRCDTDHSVTRGQRAGVTAAMSDRPDWLRAQLSG
jgi:glycerophosphoryl diester phosphodiesterase